MIIRHSDISAAIDSHAYLNPEGIASSDFTGQVFSLL